MLKQNIAVRWTMGDVDAHGYEALRLSIWGARRLLGPKVRYVVCVNNVPLEKVRLLTGEVPCEVEWMPVDSSLIPEFLLNSLDRGMAEGVAWKFAPLRLFPDSYELALDNDFILWDLPETLQAWLEEEDPQQCLLAEDVRACFGQFSSYCGIEPRNLGIRGIPPGFDLGAVLKTLLELNPVRLSSELDEQGLQVAALSYPTSPRVVRLDEVSICSPFPPHLPSLGRCGAHFVGLNARELSWSLNGIKASEYIRDHWRKHRERIYELVGLDRPQESVLLDAF